MKTFKKWNKKFLTFQTKVTIIGATSEIENASAKKLKKFFKYSLWFPFPDYPTRRMMWRSFIEMFGGRVKSDFPLSTLAHISHGFSAGSIKETCERVLTKFRIKRLFI